MTNARPDPDELLARMKAEEARQRRGKLKIFFGAAPGVGKTYAMLEAARKEAKEGLDVFVGYIEPHARSETQALVLGLDLLPRRHVDYHGRTLLEFDLEGALARKPKLLIVDELAHTNAPGSTHAKRWQDVEQLLEAGIDVYTTLNVQHLESLNDVVAQITGIRVRETVPDRIFETAEEVELVDLAPDDLMERLKEGKVYVPTLAERALDNFFRKGNLIALRELALRRMADRVNQQMESWRQEHAIQRRWPTTERLLVCVGPSPFAAQLIRAARRMAATLRASWLAVYVETPRNLSPSDRARLNQNLHLAEQLGAETVTLTGTNIVEEIVAYARRRNVSKIIVGKPHTPRWRELLFGSFVYELTRACGDIDVYVISGEPEEMPEDRSGAFPSRWAGTSYLWAVGIVAICTAISFLAYQRLRPENLVMIYLIGVVVTSLWFGRGPSVLASVLSVAVFDFCFVPPQWHFTVYDTEYVLTFAVMLVTGLVISHLNHLARLQAIGARAREQRTAALFALSRELAAVEDLPGIVQVVARSTGQALAGKVAILLPDEKKELQIRGAEPPEYQPAARDQAVARWVFENGRKAGIGTATLPGADALYVPLAVSQKVVGVLGLRPHEQARILDPEQVRLLEAFAGQAAAALERVRLTQEAESIRLQIQAERMQNALLSAVSHDLRTPLAAIAGASSTLLDAQAPLDEATRRELLQTICDEADRLNHLVTNLLETTRLQAGVVTLHREWQSLEEIIGAALHRLANLLRQHPVTLRLDPNLPLVYADGVLVQEVIANLLDNARKYTPPGTPVEITAVRQGNTVMIEVSDRGPGLAPGSEPYVFDKFYRGEAARQRTGAGLGLTICKGIVELHGGVILARSREGGGAVFQFTLPIGGEPAPVALEAAGVQTS